ncbi:MAG: AAA family ATPase [Candidatus Saccharimonas sp.]
MSSKALVLVVVQGAPAVGKTTLVERLRAHYKIGVVAKDALKELLYDTVGFPADREQSRVYGSAAMHGLYAISRQLLEAGISHILESAYKPELANRDIATLTNGLPVTVVQLYCYTTPETQLQRYNTRLQNNSRHPGHPDSPRKVAHDFTVYASEYAPLDIAHTIRVDTTQFGDSEFASLCQTLETATGGSLHGIKTTN